MVAETSQVVNFSGKVQSTGPNVPFFIAVINSNKVQASEKPCIMFHGKSGKHLCRICTETIDILSINVKRKHVFYLYIVIAML
jgi:hypothetical protein